MKDHNRFVLNGVDLNGHLVARWAAFFNVCNWPWRWETLKIVHNVPSFELAFARPLLVEITYASSLEECWMLADRVEESDWENEAVITMAEPVQCGGTPQLGLIGERVDLGRELAWQWGEACLFHCLGCANMSILADSGSFRCRVCDAGAIEGGNGHVDLLENGWREWELVRNAVPRGPLG